jgi:hypothetical protein
MHMHLNALARAAAASASPARHWDFLRARVLIALPIDNPEDNTR